MSRTRVRRRRLVAVMATVIAVALGGPAAAEAFSGPETSTEGRVVIRAGDTLWALATRIEPGSDPRDVVARLIEANSLQGASIVPGQVLVVPSG